MPSKGKFTFGIELERVAVIRIDGTSPKTPKTFTGHTGKPLVTPIADSDLSSERSKLKYLQEHMPALLRNLEKEFLGALNIPKGVVVSPPAGMSRFHSADPFARFVTWRIVEERVIIDRMLVAQYTGFLLGGIELVTPALTASNPKSFELVREACQILQKKYWLLAPECTGLHVHVGQGPDWIRVHNLRRLAGLCYAADALLAQLHPTHRRHNTYCPSNRLYSFLTQGVSADMVETIKGWKHPVQAIEVPTAPNSIDGSDGECALPIATTFVRKIPCGSLVGYTRISSVVFDPPASDLLRAYPELARPRTELRDVPSAVRELLKCTDRQTVGELMDCGRSRRRPAYNFRNYHTENYGAHSTKRTIEFRQPAGTLNAEVTVAWARIATRLCEYACEVDLKAYWRTILSCDAGEKDGEKYDALDLLVELGLEHEADVLQGVLLHGDP